MFSKIDLFKKLVSYGVLLLVASLINSGSFDIDEIQAQNDVVWSADHSTGNLSQWEAGGNGGFISQGSGSYSMVQNPTPVSGSNAVALTIPTAESSSTGQHAAYLFRWGSLPEKEYYYSANMYIPSGTTPGSWWNVFQWKSGDTMYLLNMRNRSGQLVLELHYRTNRSEYAEIFTQPVGSEEFFPTDRWVHIEGFYKESQGNDGRVIIWQDGEQIFDETGRPTALSGSTVHWSVNSYTSQNNITPSTVTIYVDDAKISRSRTWSGSGQNGADDRDTPSSQPPQQCVGDFNGDGVVDLTDYAIFVNNFFSRNPEPPEVDMNNDGLVDIDDYAIFVERYFEPCP